MSKSNSHTSMKSEILRELNGLSISLSKAHTQVLQLSASIDVIDERKNKIKEMTTEMEKKKNILGHLYIYFFYGKIAYRINYIYIINTFFFFNVIQQV